MGRPGQIRAVGEWPEPKSQKELQRFLWFTNFYRQYIRDFNKVVTPLTQPKSPKIMFQWSPSSAGF